MTIESGPTRERLIRIGIFTLACVVLCIWFLRDGFYKYPRENAEQARDEFPEVVTEVPDINPRVTEESFKKIGDLRKSQSRLVDFEQANQILGEPAFNDGSYAFWVGPAGYVKGNVQSGSLFSVEWTRARYSRESMLVQKGLGALAGLVVVVALVMLTRAWSTRAVLDENGLTLSPGDTVPWDRMTSLDGSRYKEKGWVTLHFERNEGPGRLRLDSYHLAGFKDIVKELCNRKGFESPLQQEKPAPPSGGQNQSSTG